MMLFHDFFRAKSLFQLIHNATRIIFVLSLLSVSYRSLAIADYPAFLAQFESQFASSIVILLSSLSALVLIAIAKHHWRRRSWKKLNFKLEQLQGRMGELEVAALNDCGTGLPGRFKLLSYLDDKLAEENAKVAFCIIDLDDLKHVNDTLGYKIGDQVISITAQRLQIIAASWQKQTPYSTYLACLGSDEFVLLIMDIQDESELKPLLTDLLLDLRRCIELGNEQIFIGASVGVCINSSSDCNSESLLRKADVALSRVKKANKHNFAFFQPEYLQALEAQIRIEAEIRNALINREFEVYYQPVIDTVTGNELGFEALVRWHHPIHGMVSPDDFIPVAEKTGLIVPLGEWVLKQACSDLSVLQIHNRDYFVAVNIAPPQLSDPGFIQKVQAVIACYALHASQVHFELTETTLMNANESNLRVLREINHLGIKLWIDDFGTGYSSFSYLHQFSFYGIKLDKSFIENVVDSERSQNIVRGICAMGDALKLELLGEGIEEQAQADFLLQLGCHHVQGYLFAKPMSRTDLHAWLLTWNKRSVSAAILRLREQS